MMFYIYTHAQSKIVLKIKTCIEGKHVIHSLPFYESNILRGSFVQSKMTAYKKEKEKRVPPSTLQQFLFHLNGQYFPLNQRNPLFWRLKEGQFDRSKKVNVMGHIKLT